MPVEMCSFTPPGQQIISQNMSKKMSQEMFIKLYWGFILMTGTTKGINRRKDAHSLRGVYDLEKQAITG